jgi:hypothetical protein
MPAHTKSLVEELQPTVTALAALGFKLADVQGYVATFQKETIKFSIVSDRGFWHLHGDEEELQRTPSRKSLSQVTRDAIAWAKKKKNA